MAETVETGREGAAARLAGADMTASDVHAWFVREVLPLEAALMQFLRHSLRNRNEAEDLCQDVYVRVYQAALKKIPDPAKPFLFTVARNLLLNRVRHEAIVSIEAVADLDELDIAEDRPGPERNTIARQEFRQLQSALDHLSPRCREAVILKKIEGLTIREIAARMGIGVDTVNEYLAIAMVGLANRLNSEPNNGGKP